MSRKNYIDNSRGNPKLYLEVTEYVSLGELQKGERKTDGYFRVYKVESKLCSV